MMPISNLLFNNGVSSWQQLQLSRFPLQLLVGQLWCLQSRKGRTRRAEFLSLCGFSSFSRCLSHQFTFSPALLGWLSSCRDRFWLVGTRIFYFFVKLIPPEWPGLCLFPVLFNQGMFTQLKFQDKKMSSVDCLLMPDNQKSLGSTSGVWNAFVKKKKKRDKRKEKGAGLLLQTPFFFFFPGHFAKECFMQPGGTKYSLIPEEEEEEGAAAGPEGDKKISQAEESSKKRKKVRDDLRLAWKRRWGMGICSVVTTELLQQCGCE